jgi:succinyl-CoA synthetase beta subunit
MDLLEYQAKALFQEVGIPTLPAQRIDRPTDLKFLKISYPVVLKSQVSVGNRGKVGGVRFVENTIDAIAAAQTMFNLPIFGEIPQVLLAETKYNVFQEFYLAVLIDEALCRPVLLGAGQGGMDLDAVIEQIQQVVVQEEFSPFYARKLAIKMGLTGSLLLKVSQIIESMYRLMVANDLDLVEINPLGVSSDGEVMALDGKVTANDQAIIRHTHLTAIQCPSPQKPCLAATGTGNVGIIVSGRGLACVTVDELQQAGGQISQCLIINDLETATITKEIQQLAKVSDVLLINCLGNMTSKVLLALHTIKTLPTPIVLRLPRGYMDIDKEQREQLTIVTTDSLNQAISETLIATEAYKL